MAEILLTAIINKSVEIAGNLLLQEGSRLNWLKEDINWLQREMRHIRSYIDDAKDKAIGGNSRVKNLIKDIQELAGDVDDLLDDFLPKIQQSNKCKGAICWLKTACIPCHASFADEFAIEIEKIKKRVADIDRVRTTYNIMDTSNNNNDCIPLDQRRLFLHADETEVIGLDDDFNMQKAKLLDHDLPYGVVSIVGMPGLGKTTLAKKLYRHVRDKFECSGLVYVSQKPRAGEILHDIAKQVGVTEEERKDNLEGNLRSLLKRKRDTSEQINLSSYPNIVKLQLIKRMPLNCEAFPPNLVKLTLIRLMVEGHLVAVLKKLPKLRILKMVWCIHNEERMDLSGDGDGDSFPQLEVLHIEDPFQLSEITCRDDVSSMPKLKKVLLTETIDPNVRLSERLADLTVWTESFNLRWIPSSIYDF